MNAPTNPPPLPVSSTPSRCGLALASLVLGIAGIALCLGPLAGIPAIICGHMAQSRIRKSGGALTGGGLAVAGLVMGYFSFAMIAVIGMMAAITIPSFVKAREASQKAVCVMNLRAMEGAKEAWALDNKKLATDTPTEADLFGQNKFIREKSECPAGGRYSLNPVAEKPTCSIPGHAY